MHKLLPLIAFSVLLLIPIGSQEVFAQAIDPVFSGVYSFSDLGPAPGVPNPFGGLTIKAGDNSKLLIGGSANIANGIIYEVDLVRDGNNHITGFSGSATPFIIAPFNDGGVDYGPNSVLFLARWPSNELGQSISGSGITDKVISLGPLGIVNSPGGATIVPAGFPGAGQLKLNSWPGGQFYDATLVPDGGGTFDLNPVVPIPASTLPGGPEGFVYVPLGSQLFPNPGILVSEFSANQVTTYDVDGSGNPIVATQRVFMTGLGGAEGATIDPLTGDFLFSTFGSGSDRVIVVQGFSVPIMIETEVMPNQILEGETAKDTATLMGGTQPFIGMVTFKWYSDNACTNLIGQDTVSVNGNTAMTSDILFNTPGMFFFTASYSGDNVNPVVPETACNAPNEKLTVIPIGSPPPPRPPTVGGELIPIETTSLILAGAQSFSWMIPVVLSGIGIGLFVASRKSENS